MENSEDVKPPPDAIAFPPRSSAMLSDCTMCSTSACGMLSCSWLNAASSSPMRRFGAGAAENSHRPTRRRERQMQRFKSPEQAQDFLAAHAFIHGHFYPRRHLLAADAYRASRSEAFDVWQQETCAQHAT